MDPSDYPGALEQAECITASDPWFGPIVAVLMLGAFVAWVWLEI